MAEEEDAYFEVDVVEGPPKAPRYASDRTVSSDTAPVSSMRGHMEDRGYAPSTDSFVQHSGTFVEVPKHLRRMNPLGHSGLDYVDIEGEFRQVELRQELTTNLRNNPTKLFDNKKNADWTLARSLQAKELELAGDFGAYDLKEEIASNCCKQLVTLSSVIVAIQVIIMIAMLIQGTVTALHGSTPLQCNSVMIGGIVPYKENPMYGPSPYTMVLFGAKQGALIVYRKEGWRLFTPVMLHAGLLHLASNAVIQLFIGGYLNLIYGTPSFLAIYVVSGVFGNMLSCIALPDSVSVGSSGALLGILTSWLVWIVFRWNKIPIVFHTPRNIQLVVVIVAITITLAFSFSGTVDWAAHFGGAIQGFLLGLILLSSELDNHYTKVRESLSTLRYDLAEYSYSCSCVVVHSHCLWLCLNFSSHLGDSCHLNSTQAESGTTLHL